MSPIPLSVPQLEAAAMEFLDQEAARQARYVRGHLGFEQELALRDAHRALGLADPGLLKRWAAAAAERFGPDVSVEISQRQTGRPGDLLIRAKQDRYPDDDLWCDVILEEPARFVARRLESHLGGSK